MEQPHRFHGDLLRRKLLAQTVNHTIGALSSYLEEEELEEDICSPYHTYLNLLHTYYIPFIIALGLVGNLLSCVVFLTTPLRTRSSSYYLAALAMADFGFLSVLLVSS